MNFGGEFMSEDKIEKVHQIAKIKITIDGKNKIFFTEDEIKILLPKEPLPIKKGLISTTMQN